MSGRLGELDPLGSSLVLLKQMDCKSENKNPRYFVKYFPRRLKVKRQKKLTNPKSSTQAGPQKVKPKCVQTHGQIDVRDSTR